MPNKKRVINWHLLQPCQLKCHYCYAEWSKAQLPQLFRDASASQQLISEIASLQTDAPIRLSLAGGEPLLDKKIADKIGYARAAGLEVSLITNGQFLPDRIGQAQLRQLSMLGVSIDNFSLLKNKQIGRVTKYGDAPDYAAIIRYLQDAKKANPALLIKINTVVNRFNFDDDMRADIASIAPDKWKVLRVLPATRRCASQAITAEQFRVFQETHRDVPNVQFEDNDDMQNSYLMIDPYGRFFFNTAAGEYGYSAPILQAGIRQALKDVNFSYEKFIKRYAGEVQ